MVLAPMSWKWWMTLSLSAWSQEKVYKVSHQTPGMATYNFMKEYHKMSSGSLLCNLLASNEINKITIN